MLALLFRHGAELPVPGPAHVSLDDAGERALAQLTSQGPGEPLARLSVRPGPGSSCRAVAHREARQQAGAAVGLAGTRLLLSDAYAAARLHPASEPPGSSWFAQLGQGLPG